MVHGTWAQQWGGDVPRRRASRRNCPRGLVAARPGCGMAHGVDDQSQRAEEGRGRTTEGSGQRADNRGEQTHPAEVEAPWARRCDGGDACVRGRGDGGARSEERGARSESRPSAQGSQRLSASLSASQRLSRLGPACPSVCQRVPACASVCQHEPAGPSSECRRFRREPVCASSPRPRITAAGLAKSQAKGQESRHSPKSRPLRAGCNKSLASPEAARPAYNMLRCLRSPLPLPLLLSSPSPSSSPAEVA
jgi:hypothetical protein